MSARVLYVVNHAGFFVSHRLPLALAARERGYEVHVATPRSKHVPLIEEAGLTWHPIRLARSGKHPLRELRAFLDLVSLYRRLRPDLVHHVTAKPVLYGTIAARMAGVPAVVNAVSGLGHVFIAQQPLYRALRFVIGLGYRAALRHRCMRMIFQNGDDRAVFVGGRWVRAEDTVLIAGSGVDPSLFTPYDGAPREVPVVMFASRLLTTKGFPEFVDAVRQLRAGGVNAHFVVVGDPDPDNPASIAGEELERIIADTGIDYRGRRGDMHAVFREADVVCLPSHREGLPKVLLEACSCAIPVVTTDVPGCRDVVNGENGILVPLGDANAIAGALRRLIGDAALRRRMGEAGRQRVIAMFSLQSVIERVFGTYEELLACARS